MLLASAMLWVLTIYEGPVVISTQTFQTQQDCMNARESYFNQFTDHQEKVRHHATCSNPPADTME